MSKDPAVLFYTSDFISGTIAMTDEQRGKYIMLLCLQHQQGYLTEEDMLNICKSYDERIFRKFNKTSDGMYYNERMKNESDRRKRYSESRRNNRKTSITYDKHMETETVTVVKINKGAQKQKSKTFVPPTIDEVKVFFKDKGYTDSAAIKAFNHYNYAGWRDTNGKPVLNWKQKMNTVWFKDENRQTAKDELFDLHHADINPELKPIN